MNARKFDKSYRPGSISWTIDEAALLTKFGVKILTRGELVRIDSGELAVQFEDILIDGKRMYPVIRLAGRPTLEAAVDAQDRIDREKAAESQRREAEQAAALKLIPDNQFFEVDVKLGDAFLYSGKLWTAVGYTRRKVWDNYEDEWVWKTVAGCRPATEEERAARDARIAASAVVKAARAELDGIAKAIREAGEAPEGMNVPEGEKIDADGRDRIYGGGSWFVLGATWTWFVRNNGHDGDDWSFNNVRTGGAGAIGWRVPADAEAQARIRAVAARAKFGD